MLPTIQKILHPQIRIVNGKIFAWGYKFLASWGHDKIWLGYFSPQSRELLFLIFDGLSMEIMNIGSLLMHCTSMHIKTQGFVVRFWNHDSRFFWSDHLFCSAPKVQSLAETSMIYVSRSLGSSWFWATDLLYGFIVETREGHPQMKISHQLQGSFCKRSSSQVRRNGAKMKLRRTKTGYCSWPLS